MKKIVISFGMTVLLLLVSSAWNTTRVSAQGPSFAQVFEAMKKLKGVDIKTEKIDGNCHVTITVPNVRGLLQQAGGSPTTALMYMLRLDLNQLGAIGHTGTTTNGDSLTSFWKVDPIFCNPPSGTSPAINPPSTLPAAADPKIVAIVGLLLAAVFGGLWLIPRFAQVRVQI